MNGYIAYYLGKRIEIYAETLGAAADKAVKQLKVTKGKRGMLSVLLAEKGAEPGKPGEQVIHTIDN